MPAHADTLKSLITELDRRLQLLLKQEIDKFTTFDEELPLVLVVLEEYPGLIAAAEEDDAAFSRRSEKLAPSIRRSISRLTRESSKLGIRLITVMQRGHAAVIGGNERSNYGIRASLKVDSPEAVRMLHPYDVENYANSAHLFSPGEGLFESPDVSLRRVYFRHVEYPEFIARLRML